MLQRLNLRFPALFVFFALLTLADIIVPDVIPLADEIGLALTLLLGFWKDRRNSAEQGPREAGGEPVLPVRTCASGEVLPVVRQEATMDGRDGRSGVFPFPDRSTP